MAALCASCGPAVPRAVTVPSAPPPSQDAAAAKASALLLTQALTAVRGLRSYAFQATEQLAGRGSGLVTVITGRAVLPDRVFYEVLVAGRSARVVDIGNHAWVSSPGMGYRQESLAGVGNPEASLVSLLAHLDVTGSAAQPGGGHVLQGTIPTAAASQLLVAGVPTGPVTTRINLTAADLPVTLAYSATVARGGRPLVVNVLEHLDGFNSQSPITAP